MRAGDGFAFYSPRTAYPDGEPLQAFTAIGRIRTGMVYQAAGADGFRPFRLDVDYLPVAGGADQAADRRALVHPQQDALGRRVPLRSRSRAGSGFRTDRRGDGAGVRGGLPLGRDPRVSGWLARGSTEFARAAPTPTAARNAARRPLRPRYGAMRLARRRGTAQHAGRALASRSRPNRPEVPIFAYNARPWSRSSTHALPTCAGSAA